MGVLVCGPPLYDAAKEFDGLFCNEVSSDMDFSKVRPKGIPSRADSSCSKSDEDPLERNLAFAESRSSVENRAPLVLCGRSYRASGFLVTAGLSKWVTTGAHFLRVAGGGSAKTGGGGGAAGIEGCVSC